MHRSKKTRLISKDSKHPLFSDTSMMLYTLWEGSETSSMYDTDCAQLVLTFSSATSASNPVGIDSAVVFEESTDDEDANDEIVNKQRSRRDEYARGINAASDFIVDYLTKYKYVSTNEVNIVTSMIVTGEEVDFASEIGKRFLTKIKAADREFAKLAFMSAAKVRDLGGGEVDMEAAVVCVLACRGFRYIRNVSLNEKLIEDISERTARSVMFDCSITNEDEKDSRDEKQTSMHGSLPVDDAGSKGIGFSFPKMNKYFSINLSLFTCSGGYGNPGACSCGAMQRG